MLLLLRLLLVLNGSVRLMVVCFYTGFGVSSDFGFGWLFFLGCFRPLCTGFVRLLFFLSFGGWFLLLLFITDADGRRSFPCFLLLAFSLVPLKLQLCVELIIIEPFNQPPD